MTVEPSELLDRLSATLRHDVGPAVEDEFTKTQTFMASVILSKLSKQLALAEAHTAAERADVQELHRGLAAALSGAPEPVRAAAEQAEAAGTVAALSPLIDAIYQWGPHLPDAATALSSIRATLRRDIDRRMEIAT